MSDQLGQHALADRTVVLKLIELLQAEPSDSVLEIGAGAGAITQELLLTPVHQVIAVEADRNYAPRLLAMLKQHPHRLSVVLGDAMRVAETEHHNKIVSNLPFHISEPLMHVLVKRPIERAVFILGERFWEVLHGSTRVGTAVRLTYAIEKVSTVPRSAFDPPPRTDALIISLASRNQDTLTQSERVLREILRQDDKLLKNALEGAVKEAFSIPKKDAHERALKLAPLDLLDKRVEHLSNAQFERFLVHFKKEIAVTIGSE